MKSCANCIHGAPIADLWIGGEPAYLCCVPLPPWVERYSEYDNTAQVKPSIGKDCPLWTTATAHGEGVCIAVTGQPKITAASGGSGGSGSK